MSEKMLTSLVKLNRGNYKSWAKVFRSFLHIKRLLYVLEEEKPAVIALVRNAENVVVNQDAHDNSQAVVDQYELDDEDVKSYMLMVVERNQHQYFKEGNTARQTWDLLKSHNTNRKTGSAMRRFGEAMNSIFSSGTMGEHIDKLCETFDDIEEMEFPIADHIRVNIIITSVSRNPQYENACSALLNSNNKSMLDVKETLVEEYERLQGMQNSSLEVRYNKKFYNQARSRQTGNSGGFSCDYCGIDGHSIEKCRTKQRADARRSQLGNSSNADQATNSNGNFVGRHQVWHIDSGTNGHVSNSEFSFSNLDKSAREKYKVANGATDFTDGTGNGVISIMNNSTSSCDSNHQIPLINMSLSKKADVNLLSVSKLAKNGYEFQFKDNFCTILKDGKEIHKTTEQNGLYILNTEPLSVNYKSILKPKPVAKCIHEWHRILSHRNLKDIALMKKTGLEIRDCNCTDQCIDCITSKLPRHSFPKKSFTVVGGPLDCIVTDLCGPFDVLTIGGNKYFITFTDLYSDYVEVALLKSKNEAFEKIKDFFAKSKTQYGKVPKVIRFDRGGEFCNGRVEDLMRDYGTKIQTTVGYAPEQNGLAEKENQTLVESLRAMLKSSKLPQSLWGEALHETVYNLNRVPCAKGKGKSPYELFHGKPANLDDFHEFGAKAFIPIPKCKRHKLDDKAQEVCYVGHDDRSKGKRFYNSRTNKIDLAMGEVFVDNSQHQAGSVKTQSCAIGDQLNVEGCENECGIGHRNGSVKPQRPECDSVNDADLDINFILSDSMFDMSPPANRIQVEEGRDDESENDESHNETESDTDYESFENSESESDNDQNNNDRGPRRSGRATEPPVRLTYNRLGSPERNHLHIKIEKVGQIANNDPKTVKQALSCEESAEWQLAMQKEYDSMLKNGTWELVDRPRDKNVVGCKWVFKTKLNEDNKVSEFKARLVAKGYTQEQGNDYDEVFAPVVRSPTIRMFLNVTARRNLQIRQFDIKTAFLNGKLDEEIYMKQPEGFQVGDKVCRLHKAIYGLKQAARMWNIAIDEVLHACGFKVSTADPCLYYKRNETEETYLIMHVDDLLIASNTVEHINLVEKHISSFFELKNLGEPRNFLSVKIEKDENGDYFMSQTQYIEKIIEEGNLTSARTSPMPLDVGYFKLECDDFLVSNEKYRKLTGMLNYLSTHSRPDISASVSILSGKNNNPTELDLNEVKRIIRYLAGTKDLRLQISNKSSTEGLLLYSDSDYAADPEDRLSRSATITFYAGGILSWMSHKQVCVSASSTEAEYYALTETAKEAKWLRFLCETFNIPTHQPAAVKADNQSAITLVTEEKFRMNTRHIDAKYKLCTQLQKQKIIDVTWVPTASNIADMLTKPLGSSKLKQLRSLAGLVALNNLKIAGVC